MLLSPPTLTRGPMIRAVANGVPIEGIIGASLSSTSCLGADSFEVTVATAGGPLSVAAAWSYETNIRLEVQVSLDFGQSFTSLVYGIVDSVCVEPFQGILRFEGRDLSALLSSSNTQESFVNRTSSEIAAIIAERHGLEPFVTPTTALVGAFDINNRTVLTLSQFSRSLTDWDLLAALAEHEQFDLFVSRDGLFFQSPLATLRQSYLLTPSDLIQLRMERRLPLSDGVSVTVTSWDHWLQRATVSTATTSSGLSGTGTVAPAAQYQMTRARLTPQDADMLAQRHLAQISSHAMMIEATLPGEVLMTARDSITLSGTSSAFDQVYDIVSIERQIGTRHGFIQHVRAKCSPHSFN